jgi:CRP/FNR family transcriptional regulator
MERVERWFRTPLFDRLSADDRQRLLARAERLRCRRGQVLFRQGERADAVWIVLEGWVHLVRTVGNGQENRHVILFTITPAEGLCGVSALESGAYTTTGIAGIESEALRIPISSFREALLREPAFSVAVLQLCSGRIRQMAEQYGTMTDPVVKRIIRLLLRLRRQLGDTLPLTHRELAQMTWTTTESAIRAVRGLKRQGYVEGKRGELVIRKPSALEQALQRTNGHVLGGA